MQATGDVSNNSSSKVDGLHSHILPQITTAITESRELKSERFLD